MILGIIYETISNTPVGYILSEGCDAFYISLYSTDGYLHDLSNNYKDLKIKPSVLHTSLDKSIRLRYECH